MQKGQSVIEYLLIAGLLIAAFIAVSGTVTDKTENLSKSVVDNIPNFPAP